ncbi:hypothetical protein D8674_020759 [Pyrus ussuriensis x Pyrus communis]|uniref:Uncharacterized protein n=1 Tax=Pyrus ussuriensis x Pyrus communis TaxID=2448454 RepID=A0A5N5HLQ7_9ROSA|nr:hypothetical protein D8674_020759 [Pyrus ussuriensis x Pyrus communis]
MADRRRRGVRIGTESPASHSYIASNITTENSTTNPPVQRPRQPVNAGRMPRPFNNQYILTTFVDGRLGYALPFNNGCVRAPQGRVLPAWANPGRTEQYPVNLVFAETTTEQSTNSVVIIEEPRTYQAQIRPRGLSVPQLSSRNMQNVTVEILSSDDEDN